MLCIWQHCQNFQASPDWSANKGIHSKNWWLLGQHLSLLMSKNTSTNSPCLKSGDVLLSRYRFQGLAITEWITLNVGVYFMDYPKQQFHQSRSNKTKSITMTMCFNGRDAWNRIESMILIWFDCLNCQMKERKPSQNEKRNENGKGFLICSNHLNEGRNSGILSSKHNVCDCDVCFQTVS